MAYTDNRTIEQLREHYEIEKELASKLLSASKDERFGLYSALYDEMYSRVPLHPQLTRKSSPSEKAQAVGLQMQFLRRFLNKKDMTFLEVGPGDCSLSLEITKIAKQVYAVDVSNEIVKDLSHPSNFHLILSNGSSVPVPPNSVDVAYSDQLMEHLHPDDAFEQLKNIYDAIAPGGIYVCITPNKLSGPHDISRYFDEVATGFHLKEYTVLELANLFRKVGFTKIKCYFGYKGIYVSVPIPFLDFYETLLAKLPYNLRKAIAQFPPFRSLLGIRLVGVK